MDIKSHTDIRFLRCIFEVPHNVCDKLTFQGLADYCEQIEYKMAPGKIRPQMQQFLDSLVYFLENGINCEHFHELKQNEMFLIFRWFYPKQELAELFYPMIGKSLNFKSIVQGNFTRVKSVNELACILNMSRSAFDIQFKQEYGVSPGQWLMKQKANNIRYDLNNPDTTIADVIRKYDFNSPSQFTRFCKKQFDCTPTEYISQLRESKEEQA